MDLIRGTYNYLFYKIYKVFKEIYSETLDPAFYSLHLLHGLMAIATAPIWLRLTDYVKLSETGWVITFVIVALLTFFIERKIYSKKAVIRIFKKYSNQDNRKYKFCAIIFFISMLLLAIITFY